MNNRQTARITIGTLHRVADTRPLIVTPADMVVRDTDVVRSINRIMRNPASTGGDPTTTAPTS